MDSIFWTIKNNGAYILIHVFIRRQDFSLLGFNEADKIIARATKSKDLKANKHQVLNEHGFIFALTPPPLAHAQLCCICNASFKVKIML